MNPGDSVHDISRPAPDDTRGDRVTAGLGSGRPTLSAGAHESLQDIQEIIDKLAAVNLQLRHPAGHRG
jgi:hypothetical protein